MSALSYHPVLADVDTVIAAARPDRLLLLGGSVPETMGEAGETRLLLGNSPQLATGVYRFDGEDVAVVVASVGGGPASPSEADWTAADDDPLVNAYGWLAHLWPDAQLVSKPQFGPGDEVLTVPGGQEARVRRRWFSGGSWGYDIRTEGRTVSVREDQVSEPTLDDDPGAWIRRAPAAARGLAATLTRADSTGWVHRWVLPAWVIPPREVRSPEECSEGTSPQKPMNMAAIGKRRQSQTSETKVGAPRGVIPRYAARRATASAKGALVNQVARSASMAATAASRAVRVAR